MGGHQQALPPAYIVQNKYSLPERVVPSMAIENMGSLTFCIQALQAVKYLIKAMSFHLFLPFTCLMALAMRNRCIMWSICLPEWKPSPWAAFLAMDSLNR